MLAALVIVSMVMVLGALAITLATQELESVGAAREDARTRVLAESGVALVLRWMHDPEAVPAAIPTGLFRKRQEDPERGLSFFDRRGRSQYGGTPNDPDLALVASNPDHDRLLHHPQSGVLAGLQEVGRILRLELYRPARLGLLGTVGVTVVSAATPRSVTVQLGVRRLPRLGSAVQLGEARPGGTADLEAFRVHWGDVVIRGDAVLAARGGIPAKHPLAPVTGRSYGDMARPEDPWVDYVVGGEVRRAGDPGAQGPLPGNIRAHQEPLPGLRFDSWNYVELKQAARRFGSYYVLGRDGYLYPDGRPEPERRQTVDDVFGSGAVGDHRGLVFIDTPAARAPGAAPLETVTVTAPYAEGVFIVNAHVRWRPGGRGRSISVLSPPPEGTGGDGSRVPVTLQNIHLQGVLVTPGRLAVSGTPRLFGGVSAGQTIERNAGARDRLEVWYSHELGRGLVRGMPLVYVVPGTWREAG